MFWDEQYQAIHEQVSELLDRKPGEPVPFDPESIAKLSHRYKRALTSRQFDVKRIILRREPGPETYREHCFDHESGIRLGIWIQVYPNAAWSLGIVAQRAWAIGPDSNSRFGLVQLALEAMDLFREISGDTKPLRFNGEASPGIPCWRRLLTGEQPSVDQMNAWLEEWRAEEAIVL